MPLTTMFEDVLISVTGLARIVANAIGRRSNEGLMLALSASPRTIGRKKAAAAVLLMKEEQGRGRHHDQREEPAGIRSRPSQDGATHHVDDARPQQGGSHHE